MRVIRVLKVVGQIKGGVPQAGHPEGQFVRQCDVEARGGLGEVQLTPRVEDAMHFADADEAMRYYNRRSKVKPLRSDGKPNCPLTAFTIEVINPRSIR